MDVVKPHKPKLLINQGGLMRCCIQSLLDVLTTEEEGDTHICMHCETVMIVKDGVWQWYPEE